MRKSTSSLGRNSVAAIVETIVLTIILFVSFTYLARTVGVEMLGVWSLVVGTVALSQTADLGFGRAVVRFVALSEIKADSDLTAKYIGTCLVSVVALMTSVSLVLFLPLSFLLSHLVTGQNLAASLSLLPFSLGLVVIMKAVLVPFSALLGLQLAYVKSIIVVFGTVCQFVAMLIFVPRFGISGMVMAQLAQYFIQMVIASSVLMFLLPELRKRILFWSKDCFRDIFKLGIQFQGVSFLSMLFEPVTKILISQFADVSTLGVFEVANRFVTQARRVIVAANEVLFPAFADLLETDKTQAKNVYRRALNLNFFAVVCLFAAVLSLSPMVGDLVLGIVDQQFSFFVFLLLLGVVVNIMCGPAYFLAAGSGNLKYNLYCHAIIAVLNFVLGGALGYLFQGPGVLLGSSIAWSIGSFYVWKKVEQVTGFGDINVIRGNGISVVYGAVAGLLWFGVMMWSRSRMGYVAEAGLFALGGMIFLVAYWAVSQQFKDLALELWAKIR